MRGTVGEAVPWHGGCGTLVQVGDSVSAAEQLQVGGAGLSVLVQERAERSRAPHSSAWAAPAGSTLWGQGRGRAAGAGWQC